MTEKSWFDLSVKKLNSFDSKSKRNIVGAYSWQMEYLELGTKSRDKTRRKYKPSISTFFQDQTERIINRYNEFFGIKAIGDFPIQELDTLMTVLFPSSEDLAIQEVARPMHTSALQKAGTDIATIATSEVILDSSLSNARVVQYLNTLGQNITRVNDSSKLIMRDVVLRGVRDGDNILTIRDNLLKTGLNEYYENRALTIARTESRAAYDAGSKLSLDQTGIDKFDVIGCIGTLGVTNSLGLIASYGDFSETIGSCGVLGVDMKLWDDVSAIHHPNHAGMMVSAEKL